MRITSLLLTVLASAAVLNAGAIFNENFEGATTQGYDNTVGVIPGTLFSLVSGNIDVNGPAYYTQLCSASGGGICIDTTGSGTRGVIQTTNQIALTAGTYYLTFDLEGWSRNADNETATVRVDLGSLIVDQEFTRSGGSNPYAAVVIPFTVASDTSGYLTFSDLGGGAGYAGAILDNVSIQTGSPAPEPATLLMLGAGLSGLFFLKKKVSRN